MTSLLNTRYESKRNPGTFATVVKEDSKGITVNLKFDTGEVKPVSTGTLKRWYKKVQEDVNTINTEDVQNVPAEVSTTPNIEEDNIVDTKEVQTKKKSASKVEKKNNNNAQTEDINKLLEYVYKKVNDMQGEIFIPAKDIKFRAFKVSGKMFCTINYSNKSITLNCREKALEDCKYTPTKIANHMFNYRFKFTTFTEQNTRIIDELLKVSMDYQVLKNTNSKKKGAE